MNINSNIYSECFIGFAEYEDDDLENLMEHTLSKINSDELFMYMDRNSNKTIPMEVYHHFEEIKQALIYNARYIIQIDLPYEIYVDPFHDVIDELTIWDSLIFKLKEQIKNGKLRLVYCEDNASLEFELDSGSCVKLINIDNGGIVCYCDSVHKIRLNGDRW